MLLRPILISIVFIALLFIVFVCIVNSYKNKPEQKAFDEYEDQ